MKEPYLPLLSSEREDGLDLWSPWEPPRLFPRAQVLDPAPLPPQRPVRVLAVADVPSRSYYDFYTPGKLDEFDLILSCGDLPREYLEFLATFAHAPLVYVRGNHDEGFQKRPPEGCICGEDKLLLWRGVRILGLGGSFRYREGENFYTEEQMARRARRLRGLLRRHKGFDILLTHAPARGLNDLDTLAHRGFQVFNDLLDQYRPRCFIHGHVHRNYGIHIPQRCQRGETAVINAYEHCAFSYQ